MNREEQFKYLEKLQRESKKGGGDKRIAAQHDKGKLTARERIDLLVDEGTFVEIDALVRHRSKDFGLEKQRFLGDGVITGYGYVNERLVYIFSQDFTDTIFNHVKVSVAADNGYLSVNRFCNESTAGRVSSDTF